MLNNCEKSVMQYIYERGAVKGVCLLAPEDIVAHTPTKYNLDNQGVDDVLNALKLDDRIDVTESVKRGETVYCITLLKKGLSYERDKSSARKGLIIKLAIGLGIPLLAAIIKLCI